MSVSLVITDEMNIICRICGKQFNTVRPSRSYCPSCLMALNIAEKASNPQSGTQDPLRDVRTRPPHSSARCKNCKNYVAWVCTIVHDGDKFILIAHVPTSPHVPYCETCGGCMVDELNDNGADIGLGLGPSRSLKWNP